MARTRSPYYVISPTDVSPNDTSSIKALGKSNIFHCDISPYRLG